ncbi:Zinc carboxypeptidase [Granulicatella balaenopterae]|uniref:Zinc carboxypeptidase n=1 Tax=Granulicatella balaenopterae TaxID=137733 RepID=A0A1H9N9T6_9LACT|nr:hypothetical protein [Granulicatella balaenopterae]SER32163.1 Zinc carboxypeptidase [Granulicatella balaenopterae]
MKKSLLLSMSATVLLSIAAVNTPLISAEEVSTTATTSQANKIEYPLTTQYMTDDASYSQDVPIDVETAKSLVWTVSGETLEGEVKAEKPIAEYKTWLLEKGGGFNGDQWITVLEPQAAKSSGGTKTTITIDVKKLFDSKLDERTKVGNIRRTYRHWIGTYTIKGTSPDGSVVVTKKIDLRPYLGFRTYDERIKEINETTANVHDGRYATLKTIGTSAQGREIVSGIVAKDEADLDKYLNETEPMMLSNPQELLRLITEEKKDDFKLPIYIHNTHADEQPGIDIITELYRKFATEEEFNFDTYVDDSFREKEDAETTSVHLNVDDLLDRFIFIFTFTENPDGDYLNFRSLANGMDPNRDAGYQTNPETRAAVQLINQWNPLSLIDIHGFVKQFLIEPATPPHDPNFEYDILAKEAVDHAQHMGRAGVYNTKYSNYIIPKLDWGDGWDDAFSGYTGVYALYHGILGHTMEIPEMNNEAYNAGIYATLASVSYVNDNRLDLLKKRLEFYTRGIEKAEVKAAEDQLVGPNGEIVGRRNKVDGKFFPDYYVISMEPSKEYDVTEAFNMIEYFARNGVIVKELTADEGDFKKGDLVIDMAQAKRGYANHVLYKGSDESDWGAMYAEVVMNFPAMRGFKATPVYNKEIAADKIGEVTHKVAPQLAIEDSELYTVTNNSIFVIQGINELLADGKKISFTNDGFVMDKDTLNLLKAKTSVYAEPKTDGPAATMQQIDSDIKIYCPWNNEGWVGASLPTDAYNALKQVGFTMVDTPEEANLIVLDNYHFDQSVFGDKPVIVLGGSAMEQLESLDILPGFDAESTDASYEGLLNVFVNTDYTVSSGYDADDLFYSNSGSWIASTPTGFHSVMTVKNDDFYNAGWWPKHQEVAGKTVAIDGVYKNSPVFIYAGNPTNKLHTHYFYRWLTNAIYRGTNMEGEIVPTPEPEKPVAKNGWEGDYYYKDGTKLTSQWLFDTNYQKWYYLTADGTYARNEWVGSYYLKQYGDMADNEWIYDDNYHNWFFINEGGKYAHDTWKGVYYLKQWGEMAKSEWAYSPETGWHFFNPDGTYVQNQWVGAYYLKDWGYMAQNEWIYDNKYQNWFKVGEDGHYLHDTWVGEYYLKANGEMAKNEWIYDKQYKGWYYLKANGKYARNEKIAGYQLDAYGKWAN